MISIKPVQPYPALLLQKKPERVLVITDLHLGWERLLTQKGVHIPSQTSKILDKLLRLINVSKPTRLIFLGDVKDTVAKIGIEEWRDIPEFFETLEERVPDIQVVMGNHDGTLEPLLPETVKIFPSSGVSVGNIGLFHGHAWPAPELLACYSLIMGHVHPTVTFRDPMGFRMTRQVWVKARCDGKQLAISLLEHLGTKINTNLTTLLRDQFKVKLRVSKLFIIPSFNQFLGGRPINARRRGNGAKTRAVIGPVLRSGGVGLDDAEIYLLDGTLLGTANQLRGLNTSAVL